MAFTRLLMGFYRQSKRRTAEFLSTLLGQPWRPALAVKMQNKVTAALRPSYEEVAVALHLQEQLSVDETATRDENREAWLRTFVAKRVTVFAVRVICDKVPTLESRILVPRFTTCATRPYCLLLTSKRRGALPLSSFSVMVEGMLFARGWAAAALSKLRPYSLIADDRIATEMMREMPATSATMTDVLFMCAPVQQGLWRTTGMTAVRLIGKPVSRTALLGIHLHRFGSSGPGSIDIVCHWLPRAFAECVPSKETSVVWVSLAPFVGRKVHSIRYTSFPPS